MSRQNPIYLYASDEEPTEDTYYSDASAGVANPPVHPRATSDDTSDAYVAPPPTAPVVTPTAATADSATHMIGSTSRATRHVVAGPSRGPVLRRTPRMCVRDFPIRPLAPRDKAPVDDTAESSHRVPRFAHLEWMTPTLRRWRSLEGFPSAFETGESSRPPAPLSTTGESVELTLPTLIAVMRTLFRISGSRGMHLAELQSDVSRLDGDMIYMHERFHFLLGDMVAIREIAEAARARARTLERCALTAGIVVGVCVLVAVLRTAVSLFLPYFQ